jgi:hypothetical protein
MARRAFLATLITILALSGSAAAASTSWWRLPRQPTWYWQLNGKIRFGLPVKIYDVDAFTTTAAEVTRLHAEHRHVICYVDVGTAENWRSDYNQFPPSVLGSPNGWPGEVWLDIRQLGTIEPIMAARLRLCHEKGFDAVEPDNMEAALNESGFPITLAQQLAYNEWIAEESHSLHMAVLQKNDSEQTLEENAFFDGALSEECNQWWPECGAYLPYLESGRPVLNAEYKLKTQSFCSADALGGISGARFNLALNGRRFEPCWDTAHAAGRRASHRRT